MREEAAIKNCVSKCCHSATNDLYSSNEIQKWLFRRRGHQRASVDSGFDARRHRVHRGFVLERRENPISGLRAYWRPLKGYEASASRQTRNNSSRKVSVFWRKSESLASTDSSSRCAVWQCYKRPMPKKTVASDGKDTKSPAEEKEKEKDRKQKEKEKKEKEEKAKKEKEKIRVKLVLEEQTKNRNNFPQKTTKQSNIQCQIRRVEKPKVTRTLHNSATQTQNENASNAEKDSQSASELSEASAAEESDIEDLDIRDYMKDSDQNEAITKEEEMAAKQLQQLKIEEMKRKEKELRRKNKKFVDRGTKLARTITLSKEALKAQCSDSDKCPTCGHKVAEPVSNPSDESSVSEDDSRLDQVVQNAKWALERRAAIHQLFLVDNDLRP